MSDYYMTLLFNLIITIFCYLLVPVIISLRGKQYTQSQIKKISIINGIAVYIVFSIIIISSSTGETANVAACFLWSSVGNWIMKKKCLSKDYVSPVKYCVHCGSEIDNKTKRCINCNKKAKKSFVFFFFFTVFLFILVVLLASELDSSHNDIENLNIRVMNLERSRENLKDNYRDLNGENKNLKKQIDEYEAEIDFYDEHVVFVLEGYGNYYYTYDQVQEVTDGKRFSFWVYSNLSAKEEGYVPWK